MDHVPVLKVPNLFTQMLPLAFARILYLFWITTYDVIILSSFLPMMWSFCITAYHLLHDHKMSVDKQLECTFEVWGATPSSLGPLRSRGLTQHFKQRLHEIFAVERGQIEVFKPIDLLDHRCSRFEMAFTVRSHRGALLRVENEFIASVQNEQLSRVKSVFPKISICHITNDPLLL